MKQPLPKIKFLIFLLSIMGTFGSLYFSEVMKFPPCSLCWYQRICLYPIALITFTDILNQRFDDYWHEFVLAAAGAIIAFYHNLLYYGVIENIVPCSKDVSCTTRMIEWYGFITIPLLSLVGFIIILTIIGFSFRKVTQI